MNFIDLCFNIVNKNGISIFIFDYLFIFIFLYFLPIYTVFKIYFTLKSKYDKDKKIP